MRMIYDRFPVLLAVSVTCLSLAANNYLISSRGKNSSLIMPIAIAQTIETTSPSQPAPNLTVAAKDLQYQSYMQAGYTADKNKDYLTALEHFQNALAIRPEDSVAKQAIRNVTGYAFDSYMQAGYFADKQRNYTTALKYFQQAKEIRPDSFHAQQAIRNVNNYIAVANSTAETEPNNQKTENNGFNNDIWLILLVLLSIATVTGGIIFSLFKGSNSTHSNKYANSISAEEEAETVVAHAKTYPELTKPQSTVNDTTVVTNNRYNGVGAEGDNTQILATEGVSGNLRKIEQPSVQQTHLVSDQNSNVSKLDIIPELIKDLQQSDRNLRRKTIWELAQRSDSRAMKPLVELMMTVDSQERSLILEAMTQIASRTLKPMNQALTLSLEDDNSQVRQNAIRDLTRVYELMSQVTQRLSVAVEDSDEEVQQTAKWALKQLNQMPKVTWQNSTNSSDVS